MIRGLYTAASGMTTQMALTDVVTNNLANVNTAGFKKDLAVVKGFREMLIYRINDPAARNMASGDPANAMPIGYLGTGALVDGLYTSHSQGTVRNTGNPLDVAIMGGGYFTIETPNGTRYTRNGAFSINNNQEIITSSGDKVLGLNGPIRLGGKKVTIDESGDVYNDGVLVDRLRIAVFADPTLLEKQADSYFKTDTSPEQAAGVQIQQGFVEGANVNTINEMVNLINVFRTYEANQKMVQAQDETLGKAVNEIART